MIIETGVFTAGAQGDRSWAEWTPTVREGESLEDVPLNEWVGQALGAATACWENLAGAGVFESGRAKVIADSLNAHIQKVINEVIAGTTKAVACTRIHVDEGSRVELHQEAASKATDAMRQAECAALEEERFRYLALAAGWARVAASVR